MDLLVLAKQPKEDLYFRRVQKHHRGRIPKREKNLKTRPFGFVKYFITKRLVHRFSFMLISGLMASIHAHL